MGITAPDRHLTDLSTANTDRDQRTNTHAPSDPLATGFHAFAHTDAVPNT